MDELRKNPKPLDYVKASLFALALTISYGILQEIFLYMISIMFAIINPSFLDILDEKVFLLDNLLTFPLLIIYGIFFLKYFYGRIYQHAEDRFASYGESSSKDELDLQIYGEDLEVYGNKLTYSTCKEYEKKGYATGFFDTLGRTSILDIAKCFVIAMGAYGLSNLWFLLLENYLIKFKFWENSYVSFNETWDGVADGDYYWMIISVVILGPIVEELLFRGLILNCLRKVRAGWFPIIVSGIMFGIFHEEPVQIVYTAVMGIILGLVYERTRRFELPVLIHIANNFLSEILNKLPSEEAFILVNDGLIIMAIPAICLLCRTWRRKSL